jgi:hypothetical protein
MNRREKAVYAFEIIKLIGMQNPTTAEEYELRRLAIEAIKDRLENGDDNE